MKSNILLVLLCHFLAFSACSQTVTPLYRDFVIANDQLWALTENGHLRLFDLKSEARLTEPMVKDSLVAIAIDIHSVLVVGDKQHRIQKYDSAGGVWNSLGNYSGSLYGITFDQDNNCYLITSKGVVELGSNRTYFPDSGLNTQIHYHGAWFRQPTYYMDSAGNLWLGFRYGEWGGDLFVFNTRLKRFLPLNISGYSIELYPVQGICSNGGDVFISTGVDHMSTSGSIVRFKNYKASVIFESSPYSDAHRHDSAFQGEYIGPTAFNNFDRRLYFYSQHGFFRGDPNQDLSSIEKWEKVARPHLKWSWGQQDAVGSPMNVRKIAFYRNSKMLFLTQLNGIGILQDGDAVFLN